MRPLMKIVTSYSHSMYTVLISISTSEHPQKAPSDFSFQAKYLWCAIQLQAMPISQKGKASDQACRLTDPNNFLPPSYLSLFKMPRAKESNYNAGWSTRDESIENDTA